MKSSRSIVPVRNAPLTHLPTRCLLAPMADVDEGYYDEGPRIEPPTNERAAAILDGFRMCAPCAPPLLLFLPPVLSASARMMHSPVARALAATG